MRGFFSRLSAPFFWLLVVICIAINVAWWGFVVWAIYSIVKALSR